MDLPLPDAPRSAQPSPVVEGRSSGHVPQKSRSDARNDIPSTLIATGFPSTEYEKAAAEHPEWAWLAGLPELRNKRWIDMPTSHWPMWSKPRELATIIADVARAHPRP